MTKEYIAPELELVELELSEIILRSVTATPTESGNEMPILTRRMVDDELNGDPNLDPEDLLTAPTESEF